MKLRKAVNKIVALGVGATMVGATILGASAVSDFNQYPSQFVDGDRYTGFTIVGDGAATDDTLAALDVNAGLDYESTAATGSGVVSTRGTADMIPISRSGDSFEIGEYLGDVRENIDAEDGLAALQDGRVRGEGDSDVEMSVSFERGEIGATDNNSGVFKTQENDETDVVNDFLFYDDNDPFFLITLDFPDNWETDIDSDNDLDDLEQEDITILGKTYTVVTSDHTANASIELDLMGGATRVELNEGETVDVTATVQSGTTKQYTIVSTFVGSNEAKYNINGESVGPLDEGDTHTLRDGTIVGIAEILEQDFAGGIRESVLYVGATQLTLSDSSYIDTTRDGSGFELNGEGESNVDVGFQAILETATRLAISQLSLLVEVDSDDGEVYLGAGDRMSDFMENPATLLNLDLHINGLTSSATYNTVFSGDGDQALEIVTTDQNGDNHKIPAINCETLGTDCYFGERGTDQARTVFQELDFNGSDVNTADGAVTNADLVFQEDDRFIISSGHQGEALTQIETSVLVEIVEIEANEVTLQTDDGETIEVQRSGFTGSVAFGDIPAAHTGRSNRVWWNSTTGNATIDLNGDDALTAGLRVAWVNAADDVIQFDSVGVIQTASTTATAGRAVPTNGSGMVTGTHFVAATNGNNFTVTYITPTRFLDSAAANEITTIRVPISTTPDPVVQDLTSLDGTAPYVGTLTLESSSSSDNDDSIGRTVKGTKVTKEDDDGSSSDIEDIHFEAPIDQVFVDAVITTVEDGISQVAQSSANRLPARIPVDANVLASEVDMANLDRPAITVGGPCANSATRYALYTAQGLDNPEDCAEMYTDGGAWLRFWEVNGEYVLEVAGLTAEDTRRAGKVLREYAQYSLAGDAVKVEGTNLNDISVSQVSN